MRAGVFSISLGLGLAVGLAPALETNAQYGDASFQFLKLSLSPRSTALGGAGSALVDGIGDADLNPAAAARDSGSLALGQGYPSSTFAATGSHVDWDIPWRGTRVTLQMRYLGFDNIDGYGNLDQSLAGYGAHVLKLQAGVAGNFMGVAYAVSTAFAQNNIANLNYGTGLVNVGLQRDLPRGFALGFSVVNADYWTSKGTDGSVIFPPTAIQVGVAYTHALPRELRVTAALDARTRNDEQMAFPFGVEGTWKELLAIRAGYPFAEPGARIADGFNARKLDLGLGLRWSRFGFDYAYQGQDVIANGQYWTLSIRY